MTISKNNFKNFLDSGLPLDPTGAYQLIPAGEERYVVPSASLGLTYDADTLSPKTGRDAGTRYTETIVSGKTILAATSGPDDWYGDVRDILGGGAFDPTDPSTFNSGFVAGYQIINVGGAKVAGSASGLANNSTLYTATVLIDGTITTLLSVTGSVAQTYGTLVAEIDRQLGADARAALVGGNIKITSTKNNKGSGSAIAITDTGSNHLFSSLTGYSAILTAVAGITPVSRMALNKLDGATNVVLLIANKSLFDPLLATGTAEVTNVTIPAAAAITTGHYFTLNSPTVPYYVWFNKDAGAGDPTPAGKTGIPVVVTTGDSANTVAIATAAAINAQGGAGVVFTSPAPAAAIITVTNTVAGSVADAADVNAGVVVSVTTQGVTALSGGYIPGP